MIDDGELSPDSVIKKYFITIAEIIINRANAEKEYMGLSTWEASPHGKIIKVDVSIAKNYLNEQEMNYLEHIVFVYLDFAELQAE